jgi:hypothetical protein
MVDGLLYSVEYGAHAKMEHASGWRMDLHPVWTRGTGPVVGKEASGPLFGHWLRNATPSWKTLLSLQPTNPYGTHRLHQSASTHRLRALLPCGSRVRLSAKLLFACMSSRPHS